jgi:hypothetical protein
MKRSCRGPRSRCVRDPADGSAIMQAWVALVRMSAHRVNPPRNYAWQTAGFDSERKPPVCLRENVITTKPAEVGSEHGSTGAKFIAWIASQMLRP